jgi:hypothetical protein
MASRELEPPQALERALDYFGLTDVPALAGALLHAILLDSREQLGRRGRFSGST